MNKIIASVAILFVAASCSPKIQVTNLQTNKHESIKVKKINAIILQDGRVYEDDIRLINGMLISDIASIGKKQISTIEVRQTKFADVIAFPVEVFGIVAIAGGGLLAGSALNDLSRETAPSLIVGFLMMATGLGLNRLGHAMRPLDQKSIKSLNASAYDFTY